MSIQTSIVAALLTTTTACAASRATGTHPEDMTATEHLEQARQLSLRAAESGYRPGVYATGQYGGPRSWSHWYPWYYYWDPSTEYAALADAHRDAAEELQIRYDAACALVPRGLEATSPLSYATGSSPLDNGVVLHLGDEAGPPDVVLAGLRCHRAWLMLEPREGVGDEPVLLGGVVFVAHAGAGGTEVMLTVPDAKRLPELQRRAGLVVERASASIRGGDR